MSDLVKRLREDRIAVTQYLGEEAADTIESLQSELAEQCRLNGMGAEREAALLGELERARHDERTAMSYLSEVRMALGHEGDFPSMVEKVEKLVLKNAMLLTGNSVRVKNLERAARMALEALSGQHPLSVGKDVAITALHTALGEKK